MIEGIRPEDYERAEDYVSACIDPFSFISFMTRKDDIVKEVIDLFIEWHFAKFTKHEMLKEIAKDANPEREIGERRKM